MRGLPNVCFHRGPDLWGAPVSSLSLSLGQQEAGSCYTTVNNTINSPWLINWLQTNPAAALSTLLCVTSLSCLSSSHCHVQKCCSSVNGKNMWKTLIWCLLHLCSPTTWSLQCCASLYCRNQVQCCHIRHYLRHSIAAIEFEFISVVLFNSTCFLD